VTRRQAIVPFLMSVSLLALTVQQIRGTARFLAQSTHARGTIVRFDARDLGDGPISFPVVEFVTARRESVTFTNPVGSDIFFAVGDVVDVLYREHAPNHAVIKSFGSLWFSTLMFGFFSLVALFLAFIDWFSLPDSKPDLQCQPPSMPA
jgi:Protein of unknown function (DUF3592)